MTSLADLRQRMLKNPDVRREYDALEEEFALAAEVAKARMKQAGLKELR